MLEQLAEVDQQIEAEVLEVHKRFWSQKQPLFHKRNEILKAIPHFWATALNNHPTLGQILNELDQGILAACTSIESDESDPKSGFTLTLNFAPNKYFKNSALAVRVLMPEEIVDEEDEEDQDANEPTLEPLQEVQWKDAAAAKDDDSAIIAVFVNKEMPFICQMIHELVSDPVVAYRGELAGEDDDEDADGAFDEEEDDEEEDEEESEEEDA